jgi:F-type H+-transporting ATPase subunit b
MNIDWFTFIAQVVNFLVLVALLRWFLYGPLVRAMQQREDDIAARRQAAIERQRDAAAKAEEYESKILQIEEQREELLKAARRDAHDERERIVKETREQVERKRAEWQIAFERERDDLLHEVRGQTGRLADEAARRLLSELADASLEEQMLHVFNTRLQALDERQREIIAAQLGTSKDEIIVSSTFDVPEHWRVQLQRTIREGFGYDGEISYERTKNVICGIELRMGGYSFAWNAHEFLKRMEQEYQAREKKMSS